MYFFIEQRKQDLEDSLQAQQYFADANEAESWMREKEPMANTQDYGKDEDSSEALLKKHEALLSDLEAFGNTIKALREQANSCRVSARSSFSDSLLVQSASLVKRSAVQILNFRSYVPLWKLNITCLTMKEI